jgi:hypothetical protein
MVALALAHVTEEETEAQCLTDIQTRCREQDGRGLQLPIDMKIEFSENLTTLTDPAEARQECHLATCLTRVTVPGKHKVWTKQRGRPLPAPGSVDLAVT